MYKLILITPDGQEHQLSDELLRGLDELVVLTGLEPEGALAQALADENFLEQLERRGAKLLYDEGGQVRQLVRKDLVPSAVGA